MYILDQDCGDIKLSTINRGYVVSSDDYVYYGSPSGRERGRLPYGMAVPSSATVYIGSEGYNMMMYNSSAYTTRTALTYKTGSYAPPVLGMCFDSSGNLFFTANKDMAVVSIHHKQHLLRHHQRNQPFLLRRKLRTGRFDCMIPQVL